MFTYFSYKPQRTPPGTDTVRYKLGQALKLRRPLGGQRTHYQWQRRRSGTWQDMTGAQDSVLTIATASLADTGAYRVRATNDWVTGLTLTSKPVYARDVLADPRLQALRELYEATDGDHWLNHTGWPSGAAAWQAITLMSQARSWFGLYVDQEVLYGLALTDNKLRGELPASLGQLTELTFLYLQRNQLQGALPASLSRLTRLTALYAGSNALVGALPAGLGQLALLEQLGLDRNHFSGPVPPSYGQLARLHTLYLNANELDGPFPAALLSCAKLRTLYLGENKFTGLVPTTLSQLPLLTELGLDHNRFTEAVPASLTRIPIPYLYLNSNSFTGLPSWKGAARVPSDFYVSDNVLDFAALEANFTAANTPLGTLYYAPQRSPTASVRVVRPAGTAVTLNGRIGGANNRYQWQRWYEGAGQWRDVVGQTLPDLSWAAVAVADAGRYRTRVTNTWVPNVTLYAPPYELEVEPGALAANLPVDPPATPTPLATTFEPPAPAGSSSTSSEPINFVRTWTPQAATTDAEVVRLAPVTGAAVTALVTTQYLDGLGRPLQTVQHQASPQFNDLVQPMAYDALGRQPRQYLPYAARPSTATAEGYHADALSAQYRFYRDTPFGPDGLTDNVARTGVPFAETEFEASPLNRVQRQAAPGEAWQLSSHHEKRQLERPNTVEDAIQRFQPGYGTSATDPAWRALGWQAGGYDAGELWGTQTTDEQAGPGQSGYATIEWKDKQGQVVLKQVESQRAAGQLSGPGSQWLRTYYVYDDFGHLRAVLPPEAVKELAANNWVPTARAEQLLFRYRYDARGRVAAKQVPGQEGETQLIYDELDRPVMSQDAAQRTREVWTWTKYDALGRTVLTGVLRRVGASQETLQGEADRAAAGGNPLFEERTADATASPHYYTTTRAYPRLDQASGFVGGRVLTATAYDDYNFNNDAQGTPEAQYDPTSDALLGAGAAPQADALRVTGLVTRTLTRVLNRPASDPGTEWLSTTTFYDERARPVQVQSTNARGGRDLVTSQLDFTGKVLQSVSRHEGLNLDPKLGPIVVVEKMRYDHAGRLLSTSQQLPGSDAQPVELASLRYNELGQLTRKTLAPGQAGGLEQPLDYAYNIRGWLTSLNNPDQPSPGRLFNLSLHYETGFTAGYEQYNGNLTGQKWRGRDGVERAYGYVYDPLSRLLQGDYVARAGGAAATLSTSSTAAWTAELQNFRLALVSYDDNGNIQSLYRRGLLAAGRRQAPKQYGAVDQLRYAYSGNRLLAVDDQISTNELPRPAGYNGAPTSLAGDFQEQGVRLGEEYKYDTSGNLTADKNKGITAIAYNHLNLPRRVEFGTGADSVVFRYTAAGQKVAKLVYQTGKPLVRTDYLGPYQYEGDSLRFFPHAEGRVLRFVPPADAGGVVRVRYEREFTVKDHLGNLRLAYRAGRESKVTATLEQDQATHDREMRDFEASSVSTPIAQNVGTMLARTNSYAARLNAGGSAPQPLGPMRRLAVQKGDIVRITAPARYSQPVKQSFFFALGAFVANLLQPAATPPPPSGEGAGAKRSALPFLSIGLAAGLPGLTRTGGGVPLAYARILVFDADSNYVASATTTAQLTAAGLNNYSNLTAQLTVPQDGYVLAYVGNESDTDVLFDDVEVLHQPTVQVQENSYDPWGLSLTGLDYSSPGLKGLNQYQYNGKERQNDLGLNWADYGARFYDNQAPHWTTIDPLADRMHNWSPYAFSFNNPLKFVDVDGRIPYPITIRAFAPFKTFGFGFHGDGRGYSTSSSVSARVHERISFDTDKNNISAKAWSSPTYLASDPDGARRARPSLAFTKDFSINSSGDSKTFKFGTSVAAANPKTPSGSPDINIFSDFSITENKKAGTLSISGRLTGDNFPSSEAFVTDPKGQSVFIGIGQIGADVGKNTGPFTELPGENQDNPITNFNLTITTDKKGNFTGVQAGSTNYSIEEWNKNHSNTQPQRQN